MFPTHPKHLRKLVLVVFGILILATSCSLPTTGSQGETSGQGEAAPIVVEDLPPAVAEIDPVPGSQVGLSRPFTFYFNQPMEQDSVEGALSVIPDKSGSYEWLDDSTLIFTPASPWKPETAVTFTLAESAKAKNGLTLQEPQQFSYTTSGTLNLTQMLPEPGATEADTSSAVVASFNQPVVPLGADAADLPAAFSLEPQVEGHGEWLNTSTYIYYPEPGLSGGVTYNVKLNASLTSAAGAPLEKSESWSFTTVVPQVLSVSPQNSSVDVPLDSPVKITFNTSMDVDSVESNFSLTTGGESVSGNFEWNEDDSEMTFTPRSLLVRGGSYTLTLGGAASAHGGSALGSTFTTTFQAFEKLVVVADSDQIEGVEVNYWRPLALTFNSLVVNENLDELISFNPAVVFTANTVDKTVNIFAFFNANSEYQMTLSGNMEDAWGQTMGKDRVFTVRTASVEPSLNVPTYFGDGVMYIDPADPAYYVQAVNVRTTTLTVGGISLEEMLNLEAPEAWEELQRYYPSGYRQWQAAIPAADNLNKTVRMLLTPGGGMLSPGIYWVRVDGPMYSPSVSFAIASYTHMVYKVSATDALVWAVDRRTGEPVVGKTVSIVNTEGAEIASGQTDEQGIFYTQFAAREDGNERTFAVIGEPGQQDFSLATSTWNYGIQGWDFGIGTDYSPPHPKYYVYTDRPIYKPGQQVNYRVVAWQAYNGRYQVLDLDTVPVKISNGVGTYIENLELPLSSFGTVNGSFTLPENSMPGYYYLAAGDQYSDGITFQVADYRKPDVDLELSAAPSDLLPGDKLTAKLSARYFFDAPANDVEVNYNVYAKPTYFNLPGYSVGPWQVDWNDRSNVFYSSLGTWVDGGQGRTGNDGVFSISLPVKEYKQITKYNVEITTQDESGYPVSTVASAIVHPAEFYIGVRAEDWVGKVDEEMAFDLRAVDWEQNPAGNHEMKATFSRVEWKTGKLNNFGFTTYEPEFTEVESKAVTTDEQGRAQVSFTPPQPGTFQLEVSGEGALTQILVWVSGPGQAAWPQLNDNRISLVADQEEYQPGDTAGIFIPNPFEGTVKALVSIERSLVIKHQVIDIEGSGYTLEVPLTDDSAPNVYVSVTLIGEEGEEVGFRYGVVDLKVEPKALELNVEVLGEPARSQPGDPVEFTVRVSDSDGKPVQGEFSLAVVDEAVLALADDFGLDILTAFYGTQSLGVNTNISLSASAKLFKEQPGGLGGGGGDGAPSSIREDFKDTAYWNATVVTGADGKAKVSVIMPDNLTSWRVMARGVTADKRVGEGKSEVITTKPLLIRTVTPRFMVAGDHAQISAIVHNNTGENLDVGVAIKTTGFVLDDPTSAIQSVTVPANGRQAVYWWGSVEDVEKVELVFAANSGEMQDLTRPTTGDIEVKHYIAPQVFATNGILEEAGEKLEMVSLPRSFDPGAGGLDVELASSLAGAMLPAQDVLEKYPYENTEATVSRFLPNLMAYQALKEFKVDAPEILASLHRNLEYSVNKLENEQNWDGGWGWVKYGDSNPYISAYALMGMLEARDYGIDIYEGNITNAIDYLNTSLTEVYGQKQLADWEMERVVFITYVLQRAGQQVQVPAAVYEARRQLNPWAQALMALMRDGDREILSDLESTAIRSANGAHWEAGKGSHPNMSTAIFNTSIMVYTLSQTDPGSPLLIESVRYLMAHRDVFGAWSSNYATAWSIMALTEFMRQSGELGGDFTFSASLNNQKIMEGKADDIQTKPESTLVQLADLNPQYPNALRFQRQDGKGQLYYKAVLDVSRPVEEVSEVQHGLAVSRAYYDLRGECDVNDCKPLTAAKAGDLVTARVTLTLPNDMYYVIVDDFLPAGAEVLDTSLKTSQMGAEPVYDPWQPFRNGWGWWYFNNPSIYEDHIVWMADFLPAGTYDFTYTLVLQQPGEYQVLPVHAWQQYFPEVYGNGDGSVFSIENSNNAQ